MIVWSLLTTMAWSAPTEVGSVHPFGIGVAAGFPVSATFKWMPDARQGVAVHLGSTLVSAGVHTRVQYDAQVRTLKRWDLAELGIGWHTGVLVNFVFGQAAQQRALRLGVFAGASVELRLVPAPVSVFAEVAPVLYPLDLLPDSGFLPIGLNAAIGARWFFGQRKAREPEAVEPLAEPLPAVEATAPEPLPAVEATAPEPGAPLDLPPAEVAAPPPG
jgi:hypothetical protein